MFAVILNYQKSIEEVEKVTPAHRAYLDDYYAKGVFVISGRQTNQQGGVILAKAENREALEKILALDPFKIEGIAEYTIYEFTATKALPSLTDLLGL
jgi:uncharacterized protein YciI